MTDFSNEKFGPFLKKLREEKGLSIKKLSPKLDVTYSYLSKIENGHSRPSDQFIEKLAKTLNHDKEELMIKAGKIPDDVLKIISNNPEKAIAYLRSEFGS